jgi:hypothetical protein
MDENFCQPPLLPRAPLELPGRDSVPRFELLRVSEPLSLDWLERWNPPLELPFPTRPVSRAKVDLAFEPPAVAPRFEKKCWFCDTLRVVEAAAARPLAEKLSRLGVTGNLPVLKLAFWNCA